MASLTRKSRSPYWFACFTKPDGTRTKISTKQTNRQKALAVALKWEEASRRARRGLLTEIQARNVISDIMEQTSGEALMFYTAEDWLRDWLAGKQQTKASATVERYRHVVSEFIAHLGKRAQLNLAQITPKDVRTFRDGELARGKSAKTCNLAVKTVSAALNAAHRQGYIPSNPASAVESLPHEASSKGTFTPEQVATLVAAAPSTDWRGAIVFAYFTGARLRDVSNMHWEAVDLAGRVVSFTPQKTKRTVTVPLHPQLEEVLIGIAGQDNPHAFLFTSLAGQRTGGAHGLSRQFAGIMERAGIRASIARPRKGEGRAVSHLSFHSLRHSFNSAMANQGVAQEVRQKLTGHASPEMNKLYTHHEVEALRAAINVIPAIPCIKP
ncbi:MAG: site-specific integrase [Verrucomicrobia bacterium]|nr:site-specific integrase [Verrucomicrobiota bacterium]